MSLCPWFHEEGFQLPLPFRDRRMICVQIYTSCFPKSYSVQKRVKWSLADCYTLWTHWGRETHICVGRLTIIDSDNGLSPSWRQAIIWTNAGIVLIGPLGTNSIQIVIGIQTKSFKKMPLKVSSAKWRPSCLSFNVLSLLQNQYQLSLEVDHVCCCIWWPPVFIPPTSAPHP